MILFFILLSLTPLFTYLFFFFNDTATTEIYTLSLHDALPILSSAWGWLHFQRLSGWHNRDGVSLRPWNEPGDRKSTRLNSSHSQISYAVFCLKKKKDNVDGIRLAANTL